ncbi:DivIVA domain-containing protein [Streptomyces sp. NPDC057445]|uniref:DivIVA domain-containing protein n=1 Tax=Streptomyces sp. NPDC057445 TaxID=3346136 RepID=UPI00368BAF2D
MFWFLLIAMVVVVAAVTLAVVGGGETAVLPEAAPEQLVDPLPQTRPVDRADIEALRLPVAPRGYRMADVDEVLDRLGAELAERDARIAELESAPAGRQAPRAGATEPFDEPGERRGGMFDKRPDAGEDERTDDEPYQRPTRRPGEEQGR